MIGTGRSAVEISLRSHPDRSDEGRVSSASPDGQPADRVWCVESSGADPLIIPLEQSLAIQAWIADGVDRAAEELAETHAFDTEITVLETRCRALGEFGTDASDVAEDLTAGVLGACRGRLAGTALLAMEPDDALAWMRSDGNGAPPIETYLKLGGRLLASVMRSAAEALDVDVEMAAPSLAEASVASCLARTHAPLDTVLISSQLEIRAGRQQLPAQLHLIIEPKLVSALLGALAVSLH